MIVVGKWQGAMFFLLSVGPVKYLYLIISYERNSSKKKWFVLGTSILGSRAGANCLMQKYNNKQTRSLKLQ